MRIISLSFAVFAVGLFIGFSLLTASGSFQGIPDVKKDVASLVEQYWEFAEKGDVKEASKFTTTERKGFTFSTTTENSGFTKTVSEVKLRLLRIEGIEVKSLDEIDVYVRVLNHENNEFFLVHNVVKSGVGWRIFSTSF